MPSHQHWLAPALAVALCCQHWLLPALHGPLEENARTSSATWGEDNDSVCLTFRDCYQCPLEMLGESFDSPVPVLDRSTEATTDG